MDRPLTGKTAVVTGASRGLGRAVASHLAGLGATVVLIARGREGLEKLRDEIAAQGGTALALPCDVSDAAEVQAAAATIKQQAASVDVLVNNAGIPAPRTFDETDFADWDTVIGTNLSSVFYMTRALWDALTRSAGYVVNISGTAGRRGGSSPAYGSAKYGLTGLNHAIAASGKAHGVRSTILYPGGMDTGWRGSPIGKPRADSMDPAEVARMVAYLVTTPPEFVLNEAVLNPINEPFM